MSSLTGFPSASSFLSSILDSFHSSLRIVRDKNEPVLSCSCSYKQIAFINPQDFSADAVKEVFWQLLDMAPVHFSLVFRNRARSGLESARMAQPYRHQSRGEMGGHGKTF